MDEPAREGPGRRGLTLLDDPCWDGVPLTGARSADLLAALVLAAPGPVSDPRLLDEVWSGHPPPASAKALQVLVSRTRAHTSPDLVERVGAGYRLGDVPVDYFALLRHVAAARDALASGETDAARAEATAAVAVPVAATARSEHGPLADLRRAAGEVVDGAEAVLGFALSTAGRHDEALPVLEKVLTRQPGDETLLTALLRSESAVRGAPTALARYERHREQVRDALGADPGPTLQALHRELLARDRPVRDGVLHDASRLIGRDEDVAALAATIRASRVTSILGPGGLGKTRLAHVMGRLAEQPVVHFVELAGVSAPEGVALEVGSVLGVRESLAARRLHGAARDTDLHTRIVEQVAAVPTLLVLDNCEHVVAAVADLVAVLVARAPQLRVLTTTRAPLGLASERVYPLPQLTDADAVTLFVERATAARPGVRIDRARVASLVARLDGLPLAVELAAARVRVMSVEEIERRLEDRFALLQGGSRDAPERHQTLLAVIDWSWDLLDVPQREALSRLAAFRDGFSLASAAAVVDVPDALPVVTALVDQSLVVVTEGETLRYRLLETVREFGRRVLAANGEERATDERVRRWAVGFAASAVPSIFGPDQVRAMTEVRAEEGNLVDVLRACVEERRVEPVVVLMATLAGFWTVAGAHLKVVDAGGTVEDLVVDADVAPELEDALRGVLASLVMNAYVFSGGASATLVGRLRDLGPGVGDPRLRALVRLLLELTEAETFGGPHVLDDLCTDPDPAVARLALQWTSQARENAGDMAGAFASARAALTLVDDREGPWTAAMLTAQLAGLALQSGDRGAAETYAHRALPVMEQLGASEDVVQLRALLAFVAMQAGRLDAAEAELARIAAADPGQSMLGGVMVLPCGNAELALARGDVELGLRLYRDAAEQMRAAVFPGVDLHSGYEPWVLYPEAGALAAYARHRPDDPEGARMRRQLAEKGTGLLTRDAMFLDFPVAGSVAFALALWDLLSSRSSREELERAVRLLALAERFAYSRMLPSMSWAYARDAAERACPGLLDKVLDELAAHPAVELHGEVGRLVTTMA